MVINGDGSQRRDLRSRLEVLSHAQTSHSVISWGGGGGGKKAVELRVVVSVAAMRMVPFMVVGSAYALNITKH